ncbi:DNA primase [Alphaproteobacteria bacterium]|jgi:DNA primase|nr:DNA primase [Alphaproteobacteria bacterium]MDB2638682.1 DNA primase [Alphaproteobacteria bacterium]MDC0493528.1 DNA primase [Alphaproteobacteria bacterium]
MAVPPEFIEDLRQRVPLSDVVGRRVKLIRKGRRHSGLCPFHAEKTPSFSVVDDDGFYHCFGCGVHGDAISFLREMDGLEFMEAVERLAEMAGLAVPRTLPQDPAASRQRKAALDILEETTLFFEAALRRDDGRDATRYLKQRGLDSAIVKTYRIGYSPRMGLRATLKDKGFSDEDMLAAGVIRKSDRDGSLYDYFRDRVMFPIENRQGKVIAFGARALGDAQPKYLNSGEGPTFSKKAVLYGWVQAREGLRRNLPLVVAEGYMDVIAIHHSGAAAAVAPLGTALTPEQIALLWKLHDEPVLCFDGDAAGQRAQTRALERILPLLEPGRSARLAVLPEGKDPDDLIAASGPEGFRKVIGTARSFIDSLWEQVQAEFDIRQPEARAQFWQAVRGHVRSIGNNQVRSAYGDEIESRIAAMRNQIRGISSMVAPRRASRPQTGLINRHRAVVALLLVHPSLVSANFEALSMLDSGDQSLESLKKALIDAVIRDPDLDAEAINYHLKGLNLDDVLAAVTGDDMKARLPFDPRQLSNDKAAIHLDELLQLVGGKSGLFSQAGTPKK